MGPAPDKVLIRIGAKATYNQNGGSASLGVPVTEVYEDQDGEIAQGELYRFVDLDGNTAQTSVEGTVTTTLSWTGGQTDGSLGDWGSSGAFAPRALGIINDNAPTHSRYVGLDGVAHAKIEDVNDLNERIITMGYALSSAPNNLSGSAQLTASANRVGDWVLPTINAWSGNGFATFDSSNGESTDASTSEVHAHLNQLSADNNYDTKTISLTSQESQPRSNGQSLPGMASQLIVQLHPPAGFLFRTTEFAYGNRIPLPDVNNQPIRATVRLGDTQTFAVGSSITTTTLPTTITFSPGIDLKIKEFITLKAAGSYAVPTDVQKATQKLQTRTYSKSGTSQNYETYQLMADETWDKVNEYHAIYKPNGYDHDDQDTYAAKDSYALSPLWVFRSVAP